MTNPEPVDLDQIFRDGRAIDAAMTAGVREAFVRHAKLGELVVIMRDGRIAWVPAEEVLRELDEELRQEAARDEADVAPPPSE